MTLIKNYMLSKIFFP